jgi:hypothetical protein
MSAAPTVSDMMAGYAQDAVDHARAQGVTLDFSHESVRAVEALLATMHDARPRGLLSRLLSRGPTQKVLLTLAKMYGGYVGEVLRRSSGGEWYLDQEVVPGQSTIGLRSGEQRLWPPSKAGQRIMNGPEDNVWHYFQVVVRDWPGAA